MISKKRVLETLSAARLRELGDALAVNRRGSATKHGLIGRLARAKRVTAVDLLVRLRRAELKAICRAQGLSEVGRANATLIHRIVSRGAADASDPSRGDARPPGKRRSFYDLEYSVEPGGARMDVHYIRGSLAEIKADLAKELANPDCLYYLCWYGATLSLGVYQRGFRVRAFDLHPHLTLRVDGFPAITFGPEGPRGYDFTRYDEQLEGSIAKQMLDRTIRHTADVAWDRLRVPALRGDVAREGDLVSITGEWFADDENPEYDENELLDQGYLRYGRSDLEM